jgi:hypothetical protein
MGLEGMLDEEEAEEAVRPLEPSLLNPCATWTRRIPDPVLFGRGRARTRRWPRTSC